MRFLDGNWNLTPVPAEWSVARVEVFAPASEWDSVKLLLQDQPLETALRHGPADAGTDARIIADLPPLNPGWYRFHLSIGDDFQHDEQVRIEPRKISRSALEYMVNDLESRLPVSIARALQRLGPFAGVKLLSPAESTRMQELLRLQRAVDGTSAHDGLIHILSALSRDPHRVLQQREAWEPTHQARRPAPARLGRAVAMPQNLDKHNLPLRVVDRRVEHTFDVYENRLVKVYVEQVLRRLRRLARFREVAPTDEIVLSARDLLHNLGTRRKHAAFLDEALLPTYLPTQVTMVLLRRPPYRAALKGYLALHQRLSVRIEEPALEAPLEELPRLYQVWGVLQVLEALLDVALEYGYQVDRHELVRRDQEGVFVKILPGNFEALRLRHPTRGIEVRAIAEPAYGPSSQPLRSTSFTQKPDVAIEVHRPDGSIDLYLFDPKYKLDSELTGDELVTKPVKMDIDKMHAYRDAIRDGSGRQAVRYAAILYPGKTETYPRSVSDPDIEALHAYPGDEEHLREHLRSLIRIFLS